VSADAVTHVTTDALTPSRTWAGKLLKYIRQIEVAMNEGNKTRVTQLVDDSIREGLTLPPQVLLGIKSADVVARATADAASSEHQSESNPTEVLPTEHVIRIGIDLHNVLDAPNKHRASDECKHSLVCISLGAFSLSCHTSVSVQKHSLHVQRTSSMPATTPSFPGTLT
ncbi:MAG: hypothetical protein ACK56F_29820, partial [bacterium]